MEIGTNQFEIREGSMNFLNKFMSMLNATNCLTTRIDKKLNLSNTPTNLLQSFENKYNDLWKNSREKEINAFKQYNVYQPLTEQELLELEKTGKTS